MLVSKKFNKNLMISVLIFMKYNSNLMISMIGSYFYLKATVGCRYQHSTHKMVSQDH